MTDGPELLRIGVDGVVPVQWNLEKADDPGTLTGWASVYNVVDQQEDVVVPGAFRKTLSDWRSSKRVIPLTLDHQNTAEGVIGSLSKVEDTAFGLKTTFTFSSTSKAQDARTKAREGHLNGLSIFGPIFKHGFDAVAGKSVRLLKEVGLAFVGLTPIPANTDSLVLTAKAASNTPWSNFTQADYTPEQWRRACLIDKGTGDTASKDRYALPVKEPSGAVNRNGVHAAAARIGQVQTSPEKKASAARALVRIYRSDLNEDPPEGLLRLAGMAASTLALPDDWVADMRSALAITVHEARDAAVDMLVKSHYGMAVIEKNDEVEDETAEEDEQVSGDDEAAKYALAVIGESGPGEDPPDGEPSDSLAGLFASLDAEKTKSELDDLESEIRKASEQ